MSDRAIKKVRESNKRKADSARRVRAAAAKRDREARKYREARTVPEPFEVVSCRKCRTMFKATVLHSHRRCPTCPTHNVAPGGAWYYGPVRLMTDDDVAAAIEKHLAMYPRRYRRDDDE